VAIVLWIKELPELKFRVTPLPEPGYSGVESDL
jgi:hypothetical protein